MHLIPSLGVGGTEKIVLELCRRLDKDQFFNHVVALKGGGPTQVELEKLGIKVTLLNWSNQFFPALFDFPRVYTGLKRQMHVYAPDIVHTWLTRANVPGRLAARSLGITAVISSLRVMEVEKKYHLWAESLTRRWCRLYTVNCSVLKDFAQSEIGLNSERVLYIPNGIEPQTMQANADQVESIRRQWSHEGEILIGALGRLHPQKGMDLFIKAAAQVLRQAPQCRFLIGGEGGQKESLKILAQSLGMNHKIGFCGLVRHSMDWIAALDIFALFSRWEGMPNAVMEAMLLKKPVVASLVGGNPDLIRQGIEGQLITSGDVPAFAQALLKYVREPNLAQTHGLSAYDRITKEFSMDRMVQSYQELYLKYG